MGRAGWVVNGDEDGQRSALEWRERMHVRKGVGDGQRSGWIVCMLVIGCDVNNVRGHQYWSHNGFVFWLTDFRISLKFETVINGFCL